MKLTEKDVKDMRYFAKRTLSIVMAFIIVFSLFTITYPTTSEAAATQYVSETVPAVYKSYVAAVKKAHPNWNFEFFYTGLNWNDVITAESRDGLSLISYIYPKSYRAIDSNSYDLDSDYYHSKDAGGWYNSAKETIAYYMDPRNFFADEYIFQFEKLSYDANIHNINGVKAILKGSFMDGVKIKNLKGTAVLYAQAYIDAAKKTNVSPYHLASRTIQEVGKSGSGSTSGKYKGYEGIYNFYNIGAYAGENPIKNGLKWASSTTAGNYLRPWNTQYKSIVGGAQYIGEGYINNQQNTMYFEKFDVIGEYNDTTLYTHQYMGNISAAYSEGQSIYNTYSSLDAIDNAFTFVIPVYNNMPSKACPLPVTAGSPWCWLKSLKVDNYVLTPSSMTQVATNTYMVNVPYEVKNVTISATPYISSSTVTGLAKNKTNQVSTGRVTVSTSLKVRTSAGVKDNNQLTFDGENVSLKNGTEVTKLAQQTVDGTLWYRIRFEFNGSTLEGWVSSVYVSMDSSISSYYENVYINVGKNTYDITVTSQGGQTRSYNLVIIRQEGDPETNEPEINKTQDGINTTYSVNTKKSFISGINKNTSYSAFVKRLGLDETTSVRVYNGEKEVNKGYMHTGMKVAVTNSGITTAYWIAVNGDLNGDAAVDIYDLVKARNHIIGTKTLSGIHEAAADMNGDGSVDIFDLIKIRNSTIE